MVSVKVISYQHSDDLSWHEEILLLGLLKLLICGVFPFCLKLQKIDTLNIQKLLRYFSLSQTCGPTDRHCHPSSRVASMANKNNALMYLQYRKCLDFPRLLQSIVWVKNCFYMQYNNKYHIKEQIWEIGWPNDCLSVFLISNQQFNISPHVETLQSVQSVPPFSGFSLSWSDRPFGLWNNGRVHMASCQEEGELFVLCCREWKLGCIVLPMQESFHISTKHLTRTPLESSLSLNFWYSKSIHFSSKKRCLPLN